jgi:GT2 family glycosyltransferase
VNEHPSVSVVVVAYGATPGLPACVERLLASVKVDIEVIVVDNGSTDGTVAEVAALPGVRVLAARGNVGFGGGCNRGVAASDRAFVAFVNPDVLVEPDALHRLIDEAGRPAVGIASASVRLQREPELMNSTGGAIHFLGLGWAEGYRQPVTSAAATRDHEVLAASGAAMAMRRERFLELGGFTEELFLYHEDAELSLRCWMHGWTVRYVAEAVVLHDYEFARNPRKLHLLERNRLILVLTCYSPRMLAAVAPALLVYEVGVLALAVAQGWAKEKVDGWSWLLTHAGWLRRRRHDVQAARRRDDAGLVPMFAARFTGGQVDLPKAIEPGDRLLGAYWRVVSRWL